MHLCRSTHGIALPHFELPSSDLKLKFPEITLLGLHTTHYIIHSVCHGIHCSTMLYPFMCLAVYFYLFRISLIPLYFKLLFPVVSGQPTQGSSIPSDLYSLCRAYGMLLRGKYVILMAEAGQEALTSSPCKMLIRQWVMGTVGFEPTTMY